MDRSIRVLALVLLSASSRASAALTLDLQLVTGNVTNPVFVTHASDDSGRLFIVEQNGRIKIFNGTNVLATPFLDITNLTLFSGEQGLLSVAFHPGYKTNGAFYVYFTNPSGSSNVVARFTNSPPSAVTVNTNTMQTVLRIAHVNAGNHNGGQIQFGPDGYLYIATGDGGGGCDDTGPGNNAQNLNSLLGKMLRIDINTNVSYQIPPGNPFVGIDGLDEIWSYGLRNPFRFSFDRLTGDLFIGDVGQGTREEVDFRPASSAGGENYGWRLYEGFATNTCPGAFSNVTSVLPIIDYNRSPSRAITGGYRYRGSGIAPLFGTYLYTDYFNPSPITGANTNASGVWTTTLLLTAAFNVSSFGEDQAGEIYVCRHATAGQVYRIVWRDTDSDGMADDWENDNGLNASDAGDAALDDDGDGFTNLQEFLASTNPHSAASALRVTSILPFGAGFQIDFASASNEFYRLERNDDLVTGVWTTVTNNITGTDGLLQIIDPSVNETQQFYRVRLLP